MTKRKEPAPKYTPERAAAILAEAEVFGDRKTCERWSITRQTLHNYRVRLRTDEALLQLYTLKTRMLLLDWQQDATKCLKVGLAKLTEMIPDATKHDADTIHAIAGAMKIVGELRIAHDALSEEDESIRHLESQSA